MIRKPTLLPLLLAAAALTGCAGKTDQTNGKVADSSEYEYVTPLGSNIPVRVKKGQTAQSATSPSATMSGDAAQGMMHGAGGQAKMDTSGSR